MGAASCLGWISQLSLYSPLLSIFSILFSFLLSALSTSVNIQSAYPQSGCSMATFDKTVNLPISPKGRTCGI